MIKIENLGLMFARNNIQLCQTKYLANGILQNAIEAAERKFGNTELSKANILNVMMISWAHGGLRK